VSVSVFKISRYRFRFSVTDSALVYNPNRSSDKENEPPEPHYDNHELLSARIGITAASAASLCASCLRSVDIENFNVEFDISSNDASGEEMFD